MHMILLSGGSGKRLWPLSNDTRSKQFIKIFRHGDSYESMVQRVYRQIRTAIPEAEVTIATSKSQVSAIHNQLGFDVGISIEPCRRDTFPAIALATAYLHDVLHVDEDEAIVVCPVDPYVDESFFRCIKRLQERAQNGESNLVLMGIEPTYPSAKYGYIIPEGETEGKERYTFREKPTEETAKTYIARGALWNGGVFAYKLRYVLEKSRELLGTDDYAELFARYDGLRRISFDYAVAEHEKSIEVLRYAGTWKDLGTWNTLTEAMEEQTVGEVMLSDNCRNVHALNELGVPILVMGCTDLVVAASPSGILVSDKVQSSFIKPLVDAIDQQVMFAEKSWGSFLVLDVEENSMTVKVTLNPGHRMNYHSHEKRDEVWTVIAGKGRTIVDGMEQPICAGDVVTMEAGCRHTVIADTELQMIEVQLGSEINVADKRKYEFPE